MEKNEILDFVKKMKATDHVILFYTNLEDKHLVLFTYLKTGLDQGEAAAYVAGEESPVAIKQAMKKFGLEVEKLERSGALRIIDYQNWYIIDGKFSISKTIKLWKKIYEESIAKGFRGLRVTGEMSCFFKHRMIKELIDYENALHRVLELPMSAICAYNTNIVANEGKGELYLDLIKAHSVVIFIGPKGGVIKSY